MLGACLLVISGAAFFHGLYFILKALLPTLLPPPIASGKGEDSVSTSNGALKKSSSEPAPQRYTEGQIAEVAKYAVNGVTGLIAACAAVLIMWQAREDFLLGKSWLLAPYFHFSVWYFVYDTYAMFECVSLDQKHRHEGSSFAQALSHFLSKKGVFVFHHIAIVLLYYPICVNSFLRADKGDFFIGTLFLRELSNPFYALNSILRLMGRQDCILYKASGLLFVVVFFIVRLLSTPLCVLLYAAQYHSWQVWAALGSMRVHCLLGLAAEFSLQLYWFVKALRVLVHGAKRVLNQRHKHR